MVKALLALNSGSSSLKGLIVACGALSQPLLTFTATRLGEAQAMLMMDGEAQSLADGDHAGALRALFASIHQRFADIELVGIGHRIVHGGDQFSKPCLVDASGLAALKALIPLAPLHQPHGIKGIEITAEIFPNAAQIACFDTAFHAHKPWVHQSYALARAHEAAGLKRYGFHGLSCQSVMRQMMARKEPLKGQRLIIAHLGNGCSITAVKDGQSIANSMGFSTLDGVAMGTRTGQIDPGVLIFWLRQGWSVEKIEAELYGRSGLLGLSGISNDMRDLRASSDPFAREAIDYFVARIVETIAQFAAKMGGVDKILFCGGIGENDAQTRDAILEGTRFLSQDRQNLPSMVIETKEEDEIIQQMADVLGLH